MDDRMSPFVSSFTSTVLLMRTHLNVTDDDSCDILDSACVCAVARIVKSICVKIQYETCTAQPSKICSQRVPQTSFNDMS
mmetsp:Transcript_25603/g.39669  ORF Transcript_25603/g.39669 Transcript_25603/m.39669 type:complete len:80 (+) Transcript_25603:2235-2474(+)